MSSVFRVQKNSYMRFVNPNDSLGSSKEKGLVSWGWQSHGTGAHFQTLPPDVINMRNMNNQWTKEVQGKQSDVWSTVERDNASFRLENPKKSVEQRYIASCVWGYERREWVVRLAFCMAVKDGKEIGAWLRLIGCSSIWAIGGKLVDLDLFFRCSQVDYGRLYLSKHLTDFLHGWECGVGWCHYEQAQDQICHLWGPKQNENY